MRTNSRGPRRTARAAGAGPAARADSADTTTAVTAAPAPAAPASTATPSSVDAPAPDAPTGPDARIPGGTDAVWTSSDAPERPIRLRVRMSRADPVSVAMTGFLLSAGLVVCAAVTMPPLWIVLSLLDQDVLLPPLWQLALAVVTVVLVTVCATLCALCYNLSARCVGGVGVALAEALPDTALPDTAPKDPGPEQDPGPEPATADAPSGP